MTARVEGRAGGDGAKSGLWARRPWILVFAFPCASCPWVGAVLQSLKLLEKALLVLISSAENLRAGLPSLLQVVVAQVFLEVTALDIDPQESPGG